ncbi:MAG: tetratricopeptide repeat protein [Candidatus Hodarchaeales archaeon]|jgi:tetratricopeptide (TPR) repeat protein
MGTDYIEPVSWLPEFLEHFSRFSHSLKVKVFNIFETGYTTNPGIFDFAQFWYIKLNEWTGVLDPELVYMTVKALVLAGLDERAKSIGRGFFHHAGCLAWLAGAEYRKSWNKSKVAIELLEMLEIVDEEHPNWQSDDSVFTEVLAWQIAFEDSLENCIGIFEINKRRFKNDFPLYILIDRFIKAHQLKYARTYLNQASQFETDRILKFSLLNREAVLFQKLGDQDNAFLFFEMALELARNLYDFTSIAKIYFNQGASFFYQGNLAEALRLFEKSEKYYDYIDDPVGLGKVYHNFCSVYNAQGDYFKAEKAIETSLKHLKRTKLKGQLNSLSIKKAYILGIRGKYKEALELFDQTLTPRDNVVNIEIFIHIARINQEMGDYNKGLLLLEKSYQLSKKIGYARGQQKIEHVMGEILLHQGKICEARKRLESANELNQLMKNLRGQLRTLETLSYLDIMSGKSQTAESKLLTVLDYARRQNEFTVEIASLNMLSELLYLKGNLKKSQILLNKAYHLIMQKGIKNHLLFNNRVTQIRLLRRESFDKYYRSLEDLKLLSRHAGVKIWEDTTSLIEVDLAIDRKDFVQAREISKIISTDQENYGLKLQAKLLYMKSFLYELKNSSLPSLKKVNIIENQLLHIIDDCMHTGSKIWLIEAKFILVLLYLIQKDKENAKIEFFSLKELIIDTQLLLYKRYLEDLSSLLIKDDPTQFNLDQAINPSKEIRILNFI